MEEDDTRLIERLSNLLHEICIALKGKPPEGVMYSWHDLPELVRTNRKALQNIMQILGPEPADCEECRGCAAEIDMALSELKKVGIEYQRRKPARP
jgi:hypothetical protein